MLQSNLAARLASSDAPVGQRALLDILARSAVQVNGRIYALRPKPVKPVDLIRLARAHNFKADDLVTIADNLTDYSFLGVFRR